MIFIIKLQYPDKKLADSEKISNPKKTQCFSWDFIVNIWAVEDTWFYVY